MIFGVPYSPEYESCLSQPWRGGLSSETITQRRIAVGIEPTAIRRCIYTSYLTSRFRYQPLIPTRSHAQIC